jgi:phenylacetate-CoA ligase
MRQWLVPNVVLPLYERLSGSRSWTEMRRLQDLQWRSSESLAVRSLERLRPLLAHAAAEVPYYRDLFGAHGIDPREIRSLGDLSRIPYTTKRAMRAEPPGRTRAANLPFSRFLAGFTSGSTGTPFAFFTDRAAEDLRHASYLFFLAWTGAALWDARFVIGYHANVRRDPPVRRLARRLLLGERLRLLSGIDLTPAALRSQIRSVAGHDRYVIHAYPSYATRLATAMRNDGVELDRPPLAVVTMSETLTPLNADAITRGFGCPVLNHYSTWEILHIAQTCPDNLELLHVNSERVLVRIVRDDGTAAAAGERGRVLLTDLANYVMPFINYDVGDWAVAGEPCSCGRGLPTLRELEGRLGEVIRTPDGRTIPPGALTRTLTRRLLGHVAEFQAVQTAADTVHLRLVPSSSFGDALSLEIRRDVERLLGPTVGVIVELVNEIPLESSGKRLIIKALEPPAR